jgi:hypothetical protein
MASFYLSKRFIGITDIPFGKEEENGRKRKQATADSRMQSENGRD